MSDANTAATIFIIVTIFILSVVISCPLIGLLTLGCIILYRKVSKKWIHSNKHDLWTKIAQDSETIEATVE